MSIKYVFNPITGKLDAVNNPAISGLINISDPDPTPQEGLMTINPTTGQMKVYFYGQWQTIHSLVYTDLGIGTMTIGSTFVVG